MQTTSLADYAAEHFLWDCDQGVATITLNRPERKNPLTFESYAELRDLFRSLVYAEDVHVVVIKGAGGNFCSGGDHPSPNHYDTPKSPQATMIVAWCYFLYFSLITPL